MSRVWDPLPSGGGGLLRPLLAPTQWLYSLLVRLRAQAYRRGWIPTHRAERPVISVGNLVAGGGGKTPVVDFLLTLLTRQGLHPAVLSRGYGRVGGSHYIRLLVSQGATARPERCGDEPALLAQRHPQVPVYIGASRLTAARLAHLWDAPRVFVLDDGFQHLRLGRDFNLLLVDAERGLGNGKLLPLGPLREPPGALGRADAILITKAGTGGVESLRAELNRWTGGRVPVFTSAYVPVGLRRLDGGETHPPESLKGRSVRLVCAIAHPAGFQRSVAALGGRVDHVWALPDHDPYASDTRAALERALETPSARDSLWLTTEKDAVKLQGILQAASRLWVLEMAVVPEPGFTPFFFAFLRQHGLE